MSKSDLEFANEIISIHKKLKTTADGEWGWINQNKKTDYLHALDSGNTEKLAHILSNFFREDAAFGIYSNYGETMQLDLEKDVGIWKEFTEQTDLSILETPDVGNPYDISVGGVRIAPDQPRHDYFACKIKTLAPDSMLEIGGGYGGLALQIMRRMKVSYVNIDLPETLYIMYYFLSKAGYDVQWAIDSLPEAQIVLVPTDRKQLVTGKYDLVFNSNSLSEMGRPTVESYFDSINTVWQPIYLLHQNSNVLLFPDSVRHIEVLSKDFPIDKTKYIEIYRAISPWQGAGGRYREFLYKQRSK